ncbi:hypothetical protein C4552_03895 [Candidatus Parcubacteria bacterium]|nr:MAG: hypothetical protein C4552_03895 [Candidatus Parcubacteria bacterium]
MHHPQPSSRTSRPARGSAKPANIGIIGAGFVGDILKRYYPEAKWYDIKPGNWDSIEETVSQEIIFVAVNFPDNCTSAEHRRIMSAYFTRMAPGTVVIIKSTFAPGTTDYFQEVHRDLTFCYNPEFLTEATAWDDFAKPQFQILGLADVFHPLRDDLFALLPDAPIRRVMSARDAEVLKHAMNSFFATKVVFFNEIYNACALLSADYEAVREVLVQHPWIGDSHSIIWHKGYRGFGGKCLPKDVTALAHLTASPLLAALLAINEELRAGGVAEPSPAVSTIPSALGARPT